MPYTRAELLEAVRKDHPQLRNVSDNDLFRAIATDHPDLAKGIAEVNGPAYESPVYGPTGPTAWQVAQDQAASAVKGAPQGVTGIPGAVGQTGQMIAAALTGNMGQLFEGLKPMGQPFATVGQGAAALVAPESVDAPTDDAWQQAAQAGGAMLASSALPKVVAPVGNALSKVLPSTARAGGQLDQLKAALAKEQPDLGPARQALAAGKETVATGGDPLTRAMAKFAQREKPVTGKFAGVRVQMAADPILWPESFKFASNAGRSTVPGGRMPKGAMKANNAEFTNAIKTANRDVAVRMGLGDMYDSAMREYARAKTIEGATKVLKKYGTRAAMMGALGASGGAGFQLYNELTGR